MVEKSESKIYSVLGALESATQTISSPLYSLLYSKTVSTVADAWLLPGLVLSVLQLLAFLMTRRLGIIFRQKQNNEVKYNDEINKNGTEKLMEYKREKVSSIQLNPNSKQMKQTNSVKTDKQEEKNPLLIPLKEDARLTSKDKEAKANNANVNTDSDKNKKEKQDSREKHSHIDLPPETTDKTNLDLNR